MITVWVENDLEKEMDATENKQARMQATHTHHVFHRGRNRRRVFITYIEYSYFLELCKKYSEVTDCEIHAFCLMPNHFHLLVTPKKPGKLSEMMMMILGLYARWFNQKHMRTDAVWSRRFKSIAIDSDSYLLNCMIYIELNPCRANIVQEPGEYNWSSYCVNAIGISNPFIKPHDSYLELSAKPNFRLLKYRMLCDDYLEY
jgi:putative transposase